VKWTDELNCDCDEKILKSFNKVKVELTEIRMMLKLIGKGKNMMLMLLITVILIFQWLFEGEDNICMSESKVVLENMLIN